MITVELRLQAEKDLRKLSLKDIQRILSALKACEDGLIGDIKKLVNHSPEYRLRLGEYRILFELADNDIMTVYRILHRKDAYRF